MTEFKHHMATKARNFALFCAGAAIAGLVTYWFVAGQNNITEPSTSEDLMETRPEVETSPINVLDHHVDECWTMGQPPKAELPGAAIVQFNDGRAVYTKNHRLVDAAFNEALAAIGYGEETSDEIRVIALCI